MAVNPFDVLARFYDWEHADHLDDLPLYSGLAQRSGGPILEAACGSGRLLLPLARAGYDVVGVDSSGRMLELSERRLALESGLVQRVELIKADLRSFRWREPFPLIVCALDSFGLLLDQRDQLRTLRRLRRLLPHRGLLVLDVANGNLRGGEVAEELVLQRAGPAPEGSGTLSKWVWRRTDHGSQLDTLLLMYDEVSADGAIRRTSVELQMRYFGRFELELLLERAGLGVEALFGDYDLTPYGSTSPRLIALAHAR